MIIVQRRRKGGLKLPIGSEILWYGTATNVPEGWVVDTTTYDVFTMGVAVGGETTTAAGSFTHNHTNPATTSFLVNHTHGLGGSHGAVSDWRGSGAPDGVHRNSATRYHSHSVSGTSGGAGEHSHTLSSTGNATIYPVYRRLYYIQATTDKSEFPINGIMMFNDVSANLTEEFVVCDGANGTPDLRGRFIWDAGADANVGVAGGTSTHAHTNSSTGSVGTHNHSMSVSLSASTGRIGVSAYATAYAIHGHTHTASGTSGYDGGHSHTTSNTYDADHTPPYLKLWFVMRVV